MPFLEFVNSIVVTGLTLAHLHTFTARAAHSMSKLSGKTDNNRQQYIFQLHHHIDPYRITFLPRASHNPHLPPQRPPPVPTTTHKIAS